MIVKAIYLPDKHYDFYTCTLKSGKSYIVETSSKRSHYVSVDSSQLESEYIKTRSWITKRTYCKRWFKIIPDNINNIKLL